MTYLEAAGLILGALALLGAVVFGVRIGWPVKTAGQDDDEPFGDWPNPPRQHQSGEPT